MMMMMMMFILTRKVMSSRRMRFCILLSLFDAKVNLPTFSYFTFIYQIFSSVQHTSEAGSSENCENCLANLKILLHKDYPEIVTMVTNSIHEDPGSRPTCSDCLTMIHSVMKKVEQRQGGMGVASLMITMEIMSKERKIQELEVNK